MDDHDKTYIRTGIGFGLAVAATLADKHMASLNGHEVSVNLDRLSGCVAAVTALAETVAIWEKEDKLNEDAYLAAIDHAYDMIDT